MRKIANKSISLALILSVLFSLLISCSLLPSSEGESSESETPSTHVHDFEQKYDETSHYLQCSCGEIADRVEHAFEWVVDIEPTHTTAGTQYKRCDTCGQSTNENTPIDILYKFDDIDPTPITQKNFVHYENMEGFYRTNREKINKSFVFVKALSNADDGIYIVEESRELVNYCFKYDFESETEYANPYIKSAFMVYSVELGTTTDEDEILPYVSFLLEFVSYGSSSSIDELSFKFSEYTGDGCNTCRVVYVCNADEVVGIAAFTTPLEVSDEWYIEYLTEYISVLQ